MTSLTTHVEADPASLRAAASWLRTALGAGLDTADSALTYASTDRGEWTGDAADAFRTRMSSIAPNARDVGASALAAAAGLDAFASEVEHALADVATLRDVAQAAGLSLTETSIIAPPEAGAAPCDPGPDATSLEIQEYDATRREHALALSQASAFATASRSMSDVSTRLAAASAELDAVRATVERLTVPAIDFGAGAFISVRVAQAVAALGGQAQWLVASAESLEAVARVPAAAAFPNQLYDDLDRAASLRTESASALASPFHGEGQWVACR